ncbi:drug/metabolite transporter (DMT)-like permease [Rubricella aquisinus]|uniref:Drug/metabolite transporter (DMT)-like permease n=2 Tax=Rubricella aquisinus TaxID=2028108 RepID=A0A840X409_9RHOB|nr:drug/metabolite transporter (DMT)-like permease [Rubricella aquisinus]
MATGPARRLGAFEFARVQLIACAALMALLCSLLGLWAGVTWSYWPHFVASVVIGIIPANLAMVACLRRGGPRRTELLLTAKPVIVAAMAFIWLGEVPTGTDLLGALIVMAGIILAILYGSAEGAESDRMDGPLWPVIGLGLLAASAIGFGFLVMKPAMLAGTDPLAVTAIRLMLAAFVMSVIGLWPSPVTRPAPDMTPALLGRTILPGVIGYILSSSLLLYAFAVLDAGVASALGSLSPVLILPILWWVDGKRPRLMGWIGALLAVLGTGVIVAL